MVFKMLWRRDMGRSERARFHFREGQGERPPSDWSSFFGGSAWTQVEDGQWYLHLFAPAQPDWNWGNPEVQADFSETFLILRGDRGVDGFRWICFPAGRGLPEELPSWDQLISGSGSAGAAGYPPGKHPLWDRDRARRDAITRLAHGLRFLRSTTVQQQLLRGMGPR